MPPTNLCFLGTWQRTNKDRVKTMNPLATLEKHPKSKRGSKYSRYHTLCANTLSLANGKDSISSLSSFRAEGPK
eukprot:scaffold5444_cov157-Amphora_coffeaeformis.AAC.2